MNFKNILDNVNVPMQKYVRSLGGGGFLRLQKGKGALCPKVSTVLCSNFVV